ncbi:MAG: hypothetical protein AB1Z23_12210 [Eubacteriales bacterium]
MKALKTFLAVLLTIAIVLVSICTVVSVNSRVVFANPQFYRVYLPKLGVYDAVYDITMDYIVNQALASEGLHGQEDMIYDVLTETISKEQFSEYLGQMLGDALDSIAYNRGEMHMPIRDIIDDLLAAIENSSQMDDMDDEQKEMAMNIVRDKLSLPDGVDDTLREYLYYGFQYDEQKMEKIDYVLDEQVHSYAVRLTNTAILSSIVLALLIALLYLVSMDKRNRFLKILSGINIFYIVIYFIVIGTLITALCLVPVWLQADKDSMLNMVSTAITDLVKSVLYLSIIATVILITLKIIFKQLIKANNTKAQTAISENEDDAY